MSHPENRPLQYYLSQRSHPLEPDEDSLFFQKSSEQPSNHHTKSLSLPNETYLPAFPANLEEFITENKQSILKSSSRGSGRVLLPNPYPKKNSHRSSFAADENENQKQQEKEGQRDEYEKNSKKNSFSVEEFKEYNKKFQGKKLSERLDMISQEFESKVIGDLKKIEEKISEPKPPNVVIVKTSLTPRNKNSEVSMMNEAHSRNINDINNTNETLNERYVSIEKKEEKFSSILNKKTFSSNSKYDQNMDLEYSPFTNKVSNENSRSYLLGTQSQKKELIKVEEFSEWENSAKKPNAFEINKKIRQDSEASQKKGDVNMKKKKDFLIQTNLSPTNQDILLQFRNLSVSPIDQGSVLKKNSFQQMRTNTTDKKYNLSGKKNENLSANFSGTKGDALDYEGFSGEKNTSAKFSGNKGEALNYEILSGQKNSSAKFKTDTLDYESFSGQKNTSAKKEPHSQSLKKKDQTCQANFESFDQYFVYQHSIKKEKKIDEDENFNSLGQPVSDPSIENYF